MVPPLFMILNYKNAGLVQKDTHPHWRAYIVEEPASNINTVYMRMLKDWEN